MTCTNTTIQKSYCWDVFKKSECETCPYFVSYQAGTADLEAIKEIVLIDPETQGE